MRLRSIIESLQDELDEIAEYGYKLVEKVKIIPYTMMLLHNEEEGSYDIALTTDEDEFTSFDAQITKAPRHQSNFIQIGKQIVMQVKEWLNKYGDLSIGSFNKERTHKYYRLCKRLGLNISDISFNKNDGLPDSYDFTVYANP